MLNAFTLLSFNLDLRIVVLLTVPCRLIVFHLPAFFGQDILLVAPHTHESEMCIDIDIIHEKKKHMFSSTFAPLQDDNDLSLSLSNSTPHLAPSILFMKCALRQVSWKLTQRASRLFNKLYLKWFERVELDQVETRLQKEKLSILSTRAQVKTAGELVFSCRLLCCSLLEREKIDFDNVYTTSIISKLDNNRAANRSAEQRLNAQQSCPPRYLATRFQHSHTSWVRFFNFKPFNDIYCVSCASSRVFSADLSPRRSTHKLSAQFQSIIIFICTYESRGRPSAQWAIEMQRSFQRE